MHQYLDIYICGTKRENKEQLNPLEGLRFVVFFFGCNAVKSSLLLCLLSLLSHLQMLSPQLLLLSGRQTQGEISKFRREGTSECSRN